jgi:diacylglycerol kinase family enzyme
MTGVGFDARVVARVSRALKRRIGPFAFVVAFVQVMLGYGKPRYTLTCNGTRATAPFIVVAKGRYYGGPFRIAPDAALSEPRLHACLFESGGVVNAVRYGLSLIANRLPRQPDFRILTGTDMSIEGPAGEPIQADGERAGELPARIRLCPETASLVVPPDPAANE